MFGTKDVEVEKGFKTPQFIQVGPNELMIKSLEHTLSSDGNKFKVIANLETKPMPKEGSKDFEGWEGAKGQIGRVDLSIYTTGEDDYMESCLSKIVTIADSMGAKAQIDTITANEIGEYLGKVSKVLANKFVWFLIAGEEYEHDDKVKTKIKLPRWNYVAPTEPELKAKMKDKKYPTDSDEWFFKRVVKMDSDKPEEKSSNDVFTEGNEDF